MPEDFFCNGTSCQNWFEIKRIISILYFCQVNCYMNMYYFQQVKIGIWSEDNFCNGSTCQHLFEIKLLAYFKFFLSGLLQVALLTNEIMPSILSYFWGYMQTFRWYFVLFKVDFFFPINTFKG